MSEFVELLKKFKILYCEDEPEIRENLLNILKRRTDNIISAEDGAKGLKKFKEESPDFIITDIQMPNMTGLEMVKAIREIDEDIPVIVTTAFSDQDYFLDSINLGIDKYLIKPINKDELLKTIEKLVRGLEDKKTANKFRLQKEQEKLIANTDEVISKFADTFPSPILILEDNEISYINNKFMEIAGVNGSRQLLSKEKCVDDFLEKREDFCHSISQLKPETPFKNRVSTHTDTKGRRIFQVIVEELEIENHTGTKKLYIFNDITVVEYQKLKIKHYNLRLEDLLIQTKYKVTSSVEKTQLKEESSYKTREMSNDEAEILRKSHTEKITAENYVSEIDPHLFEEIDELGDLEDEFDNLIIDFSNTQSKELLLSMVGKIDKYAFTVKALDEFGELAQALFSTRDVLSNIDELDEKKAKTITMFLENILHDLSSWRKSVFAHKTAIDIHYLDASLFSSCLQLELSLTGVKATDEDDEDDLELF
ncbi:MAG: response regulator [Campylobacterales bacterium]|nr:response regulator [Campylobacterales bacterium]